ncbi:MAG: YfiR family protein [Vitreoscilla sp.]
MLASSMAEAIDRDQLEAAVVYNILQFVEWPGEEALQPGSPLTLCMDPDSPGYTSMHQLSGRGLRRMQFVVEPLVPQTRRCNVAFVDSARSQRSVSTRQGAGTDGALLVVAGSHFQPTEAPIIQLSEAGGKLAFDVSADKARAQGLVVSSRLLRLARKVSE